MTDPFFGIIRVADIDAFISEMNDCLKINFDKGQVVLNSACYLEKRERPNWYDGMIYPSTHFVDDDDCWEETVVGRIILNSIEDDKYYIELNGDVRCLHDLITSQVLQPGRPIQG